MTVFLNKGNHFLSDTSIKITGSKSESNRLLILQAIYPNLSLENVSQSDDTLILKNALSRSDAIIDVQHAGTAMRFLTAYFSICEGRSITLTGSDRMKKRPLGILVKALRDLGADINYEGVDGFPPLKINGRKIHQNKVSVDASESSQYISALMLIAPSLPYGLVISLEDRTTSAPYITMTLSLLNEIGVHCRYTANRIEIYPTDSISDCHITIESDWSSASYFYSAVALGEDISISLKNFKKESRQGDSSLVSIFENLGVSTTFDVVNQVIRLSKNKSELPESLQIDLVDTPDLAQSIATTCFGLKVPCILTGLHTLRIKETNRLIGLKTQLEKLGAEVTITNDTISVLPNDNINSNCIIETFEDHRMAMAFAPLALKVPLHISNPTVVSKSFPTFWEDLQQVGISVQFQ